MGRKCEQCGEVFSTDPADRGDMADPLRCPSCGEQHAPQETADEGDAVLEITISVRAPSGTDVEIQGGGA